jgi:hypothetical protein
VALSSCALGIGGMVLGVETPSGQAKALLMAAGWMINLAVAEWIIRRRT